jgi:hypothetical protein
LAATPTGRRPIRSAHRGAGQHGHQRGGVAVADRLGVGHGVDAIDPEPGEGTDPDRGPAQQVAWPFPQHAEQGRPAGRGGFQVGRTLVQPQPDEQADREQPEAGHEGDPQAPAEQCGLEQESDQQHGAGGQHRAGWRADRGRAAGQAPTVGVGVLDGHQRGAAELATHREALHQPQQDQQHRRDRTDLGAGGQGTG